MDPRSPEVSARHEQVGTLLRDGHSVPVVATKVGLTESRVYILARRHGFPTNRPIKLGGPMHTEILRLLGCGSTVLNVSRRFNQAPARIRDLLQRHTDDAARLADRHRLS